MATLYFLAGSSSVGKTMMIEQHESVDPAVKRVKMDFTSIRQELDNPTWEDLATNAEIATAQQTYGFAEYLSRISNVAKDRSDQVYIFERSPFDIAAYSKAFGLQDLSILQANFTNDFLAYLQRTGNKIVVIHRPVNQTMPYDRRNNTRPDQDIRMATAQELAFQLSMRLYAPYDVIKSADVTDTISLVMERLQNGNKWLRK